MRQYHAEHEEWLRATGGKPYRVALNSIDARSWLAADRRYSRSATEREPMQSQIAPKAAIVGQLVNANPWGAFAGGCWLVADIISGNTFILDTTSAREWMARDARYSRVFL
jgi:hypothetical protein